MDLLLFLALATAQTVIEVPVFVDFFVSSTNSTRVKTRHHQVILDHLIPTKMNFSTMTIKICTYKRERRR